MKVWRLVAVLAYAFSFDGCGGSGGGGGLPGEFLTITAVGGSDYGGGPGSGNGGNGGAITGVAVGAMKVSASTSPPAAPTLPTPPTTGTELTNAMITAGTPIAGNILVSSTLQISAGVSPAVIASSTGDVVISGTLIGERGAGSTTIGVTVNAPAGTIYVLGELRTRGTAGAPDNPNGGAVILNAQRIIVTGTIDTSGEALPAGTGGNGGNLSMDTTGGGGTSLFLIGYLTTSGGPGG